MTLPISIIVAAAENGIIGSKGDMPWKLSSDLKRFKAITTGNPIIMGRKTFESIGRPLPDRHNIVVSRNASIGIDGVVVSKSADDALAVARNWAEANGAKEICIIGGGEIYRQFMDIADRIYFTKVLAAPDGDTCFPEIDQAIWKQASEEFIAAGPRDSVDSIYQIFERR